MILLKDTILPPRPFQNVLHPHAAVVWPALTFWSGVQYLRVIFYNRFATRSAPRVLE
jgi:hypothetical protein